MGEMVVFSVLLILGLFLLFNGQKSLKKFKEYNQQWHNIALYYQQTKNGADLRYIDFVVDDIKNMDNFQEKTNKLNSIKDKVYFSKKYQDDYLFIEKMVKKLQKIIPFFSYFSIFTGLICCLSVFIYLDKQIDIRLPFVGIVSVILLFFSFLFLSSGHYVLKTLSLLKRYSLCCHYFQSNDYKNMEELFTENGKNGYYCFNIQDEIWDIFWRAVFLTIFYISLSLFALTFALDKSFYQVLVS
ncbi:MAG: hypothetical protein J5680_01880 [Neisseriaceae bacterium]|nr:hypothetical protein [Neisseriaceae bacterium]